MPAKSKMSQSDKHAIVMLAECHRRDGHKDFIARTSRELSVPNHVISHLLKRYKDGELDMTSEVVTQFSTEEWGHCKKSNGHAGGNSGQPPRRKRGW